MGTLIMGVVWGFLYLVRKDLRKAMIWSGVFYLMALTIGFIAFQLSTPAPEKAITPGYWTPPTLFNLGQNTGGYAIEDALFMFFGGGIAGAVYEFIARERINVRSSKKLKKRHALWFGLLGASLIYWLATINSIYLLISFQFFGALAVMYQRRDLIVHSIVGGFLFLFAYGAGFLLFNLIYPDFIANYYHLRLTSGIMLLGVPLEEYLYAFSFGMLWAPIYEYEHRVKDRKQIFKKRLKV